MRSHYLSKAGTVNLESIPNSRALYEFGDGYHPVPNKTVLQSVTGEDQPIVVLAEGQVMPLGESKGLKVENLLKSITLAKQTGTRLSLSRWAIRALLAALPWLGFILGFSFAYSPIPFMPLHWVGVIMVIGSFLWILVSTPMDEFLPTAQMYLLDFAEGRYEKHKIPHGAKIPKKHNTDLQRYEPAKTLKVGRVTYDLKPCNRLRSGICVDLWAFKLDLSSIRYYFNKRTGAAIHPSGLPADDFGPLELKTMVVQNLEGSFFNSLKGSFVSRLSWKWIVYAAVVAIVVGVALMIAWPHIFPPAIAENIAGPGPLENILGGV